MEELKVGDIIKERYELVRFLGSGSFGEVWLAHDVMTGRDVALKIYLSLDPAGVDEFQMEYANTLDLSGENLLTPDHFDVYGRRPFLVMKYCENGSSTKLAGNISEDKLWDFIHDVASGLAVLHNSPDPIVHQDIKPDNILIDNSSKFLITDFGISKRLRATMRRQSQRNVSSGAMPYMAPERFDSTPKLNTASDIWSLGASIYEMATGELPFSGFGGAMQKNGAEMPVLRSSYSNSLTTLMQRCLSVNPSERPTASELRNWAITKDVPNLESQNRNDEVQVNGADTKTVIENTSPVPVSSGNSFVKWIIGVVIIAAICGVVWYIQSKPDDKVSESITQTSSDSSVNNEVIAGKTSIQSILESQARNVNGKTVHFYSGTFDYGQESYPIMVGFIADEDGVSQAVYKNVTFGGRIPMSVQTVGEKVLLKGKAGNNVFTIELAPSNGNQLTGIAMDGNKRMDVSLTPTSESFDMSVSASVSNSPYDIKILANAFISNSSGGVASWTCLNNTSAKRLSRGLEDDPSKGGLNIVRFEAPLTANGKPLAINQTGDAIDWDISLLGPNVGATTIVFSAYIPYGDLNDIAKKISNALKGSYVCKRDSEYGMSCVYYFNIRNMKLAICCSFGAHGGGIDAVIGDNSSVNEYVDDWM